MSNVCIFDKIYTPVLLEQTRLTLVLDDVILSIVHLSLMRI